MRLVKEALRKKSWAKWIERNRLGLMGPRWISLKKIVKVYPKIMKFCLTAMAI